MGSRQSTGPQTSGGGASTAGGGKQTRNTETSSAGQQFTSPHPRDGESGGGDKQRRKPQVKLPKPAGGEGGTSSESGKEQGTGTKSGSSKQWLWTGSSDQWTREGRGEGDEID